MMSQVIQSTPSPVWVSVTEVLAAEPRCDGTSLCNRRGGVTVHHDEG